MDNKVLVIEKESLVHNINLLKDMMNTRIIAVLKGDGYGIGLLEMAEILSENGIDFFAVSEISEAISLRESGFNQEVLLLTPVFDEETITKLIDMGITLAAASLEVSKKYDLCAMKQKTAAKVHIKVDTGFGRFGFLPSQKEDIVKVLRLEHIKAEGIYSHFSCSFEKKYKSTKKQLEVFNDIVNYIEGFSFDIPIKHIANSSAALRFPETRLNAVRLGSAILGRLPIKNIYNLKKIAYLESTVLTTKTLPADHNIGYANTYKTKQITDIAIIPVGYKDGFMVEKSKDTFRFIDILRYLYSDIRSFNRSQFVFIEGKEYKIIGRVGLYNIVVDITHSDVKAGSIVRLEVNPLLINSNIKRELR